VWLACSGASSQPATPGDEPTDIEPEEPQHVIVTGSRVFQPRAAEASPVQVLNRDDIRTTGANTLREVLDTLAATSTNGAALTDINGTNAFAFGASQASLRNLGAQSTLLLLNGRRIAMYPLPNFQEAFSNLDSLPLEAVERIEILKTGGSAVYGSDAIAGVINVITRTDYRGLQAMASSQKSLENGHFGERVASLVGGLGDFAQDGYNVLAEIEFYHRDEVVWGTVLDSVNPRYAANSAAFGTGSTYAWPGNLIGVGSLPGCPGERRGLLCLYDRYQRIEAVPETHRVNSLLAGRRRLAEGTELYSEVLYSDIHETSLPAFPVYGSQLGGVDTLNPFTGLQSRFWFRGLPATHPLNPTGQDDLDFRYRFVDAGSFEHADTTQYRALAGVKGSSGDWAYDAAAGFMGGSSELLLRGDFSNAGFLREIGDYGHVDPLTGELTPVAPDFFNKPGGYRIGQANSPQVLANLFPVFGWRATTHQYFIDGSATREVGRAPGGPMALAAGFEWRRESVVVTETPNLAHQDIVGYAFSESDGARSFGAVFAELQVPLAASLSTGLAARVDKFPGVAAHLSPRVNLRYQPTDAWVLRGTIESGFRAPNLQESSPATKTEGASASDPQRCPAASRLEADLRAQAARTNDPDEAAFLLARADRIHQRECAAGVWVITQSNPALKPETALSKSLGFVLQPLRRWRLSVDGWSIHRRNEINLASVQDLLASESSQPPGVITRDPLDPTGVTDPSFTASDIVHYGVRVGPLSSIRLQFDNLLETRTSGVDIGVSGESPTPVGKLAILVDATYTANYQVYSPTRNGTGGWGDNLAGRYLYPQWNLSVANSLETGSFTQSLRWVHRSAQKLQLDFNDQVWSNDGCVTQGFTLDQCHLRAYDRWDYALWWQGGSGLSLGAQVINVFGQRPPFDLRSFIDNGNGIVPTSIEDAAGRQLKVSIRYAL
jgi:iron complex outermembrane receptor protein